MAQQVKNLPEMQAQETQVPSLGWEDPLEKEMTTHSSIPAWKIPWTEEPGGLQWIELQRVRHTWAQHGNGRSIHTHPRSGGALFPTMKPEGGLFSPFQQMQYVIDRRNRSTSVVRNWLRHQVWSWLMMCSEWILTCRISINFNPVNTIAFTLL